MKYYVIVDDDRNSFIKYVENYINNGWKCLGGASVTMNLSQVLFTQTLVKEEESDFS